VTAAPKLSVARIERTSTVDHVVSSLRSRILSGAFRPGTALPEVALASTLGISRNTLREGLRILAAEGLVKRHANRGAVVAGLSQQDLAEIFRLRAMIELQAVDAEPIPKALDRMRRSVKEMDHAITKQDWEGIVEADRHFHSGLVSFLGSPRLENFHSMLLSELRLGLAVLDRSMDKPVRRIATQHAKMLQLIEDGKKSDCAALLKEHLDDSESRLRKVLYSDKRG